MITHVYQPWQPVSVASPAGLLNFTSTEAKKHWIFFYYFHHNNSGDCFYLIRHIVSASILAINLFITIYIKKKKLKHFYPNFNLHDILRYTIIFIASELNLFDYFYIYIIHINNICLRMTFTNVNVAFYLALSRHVLHFNFRQYSNT